jgi:hypothetical protein
MDTQQPTSQDANDSREKWERPQLMRLATDSTLANGAFGTDGGGGFNQNPS